MKFVIKALTTPSELLSLGILLLSIVLNVCYGGIPALVWRFLCCVPLLLCLVHALCYPFGKMLRNKLVWFGLMYLLAALMALWQFAEGNAVLRSIGAVVITVLAVANCFYIPTGMMMTRLHCYARGSWADSFVKTLRSMEKEYPLSDWKGIDYAALEEEFLPRVQAAESRNDVAELGIAINDFCERFYDGHVNWSIANNAAMAQMNEKLYGNDYGLSMITLDGGEMIAVSVEPGSEAEGAGIRTGTVITHWDGVPVQQAKETFRMPFRPPVKENEEPVQSMLLAGQGGETVTVTFLAEDGQPKTVQLSRIGGYTTRYNQSYSRFHRSTDTSKNFSYKMVSDNCGYLRIKNEAMGALATAFACITNKAPFITKRVDRILSELQAQGMKHLIIDIRNNTGGLTQVSAAVAMLFTEESRTYSWLSDGKTENEVSITVTGNGKWKDLPVTVLVNRKTVSAGDAMTLLLGDCDNMTLMGMTHSNCSCQAVGGMCVLAGGHYAICYPVWWEVDAKGDPFIDTDASRASRIPLDVRIPLDAAAAEKMYTDESYDHELEYALNDLKDRA